jgi:diacylglycerol kinase
VIHARLAAFAHALRGARRLLATQPHARFHALASAAVIGLAAWLRVSRAEWALLAIAIAMVWAAEAFNTAIESLADEVSTEWRERIKHAKDLAACGVLAAALGAAAAGLLVFVPYLL